jgi:hypothetical protein
MSGGFTLFPELVNGQSAGYSTSQASSAGTLVQGGTGASNTKGSWVQLTSSTSSDATWMLVELSNDNSAGINCNNFLYDIGIGAAASEVVIASNLHSAVFYGFSGETYLFPVCIPAGTRIAARMQADFTAVNSGFCAVHLFDSAMAMPVEGAGLDDMGTNTGNSTLTSVTRGVSGTKGAYSQLTASTARDYAGLLVSVFCTEQSTNGAVYVESIDIAVGGAGSEQIIIPDFAQYQLNSGLSMFVERRPYMTPIPAGTRISARASTNKAAAAGSLSVAVHGIYT